MTDAASTARRTFTVPETAKLLGISRMAAYAAVAAKEIPSLRIGRRLLVPRLALERMLAEPDAKADS